MGSTGHTRYETVPREVFLVTGREEDVGLVEQENAAPAAGQSESRLQRLFQLLGRGAQVG